MTTESKWKNTNDNDRNVILENLSLPYQSNGGHCIKNGEKEASPLKEVVKAINNSRRLMSRPKAVKP